MRKLSVSAFIGNPANLTPVRIALEQSGLAHDISTGGIEAAIAQASHWPVVPECVILDVSEEEDQRQAVVRFGESAPGGETHLIVLGREADIKTYRSYRELGAAEYLPSPASLEDVVDAIERAGRALDMRAGLPEAKRIILVTSARGGAGGSTVTAEMARAAAVLHGKKTLIVDLDLDYGVQHNLFDIGPTQQLHGLLADPSSVDALAINRSTAKPKNAKERLISILSDASAAVQGPSANTSVDAPIDLAKAVWREFDAIVFDVPFRSPYLQELLDIAGTVFIVTPPTYLGLRETLAIVTMAEKGRPGSNVTIAINKSDESKSGLVETTHFAKGLEGGQRPDFRAAIKIVEVPYAPKTIRVATVKGESVAQDGSPVAKAMRDLAARMPTAPDGKPGGGFFAWMRGGR